jgi:hypothetical protein
MHRPRPGASIADYPLAGHARRLTLQDDSVCHGSSRQGGQPRTLGPAGLT